MEQTIELLNANLLEQSRLLRKISYWLNVMNRPNGWHYDLDKIWILNELEKRGVQRGSTILDAGSGQSEMPYLLASMGYRVISLDFSERSIPSRSKGIFNVEGDGKTAINYKHPYMSVINYGNHSLSNHLNLSKLVKFPYVVGAYIKTNFFRIWERYFQGHGEYGSIRLLRAPFHELPLKTGSIDAIYSISAIEHADINLFDENIKEFERVLKIGGAILITTSANKLDKSSYDEETSGICFSKNDLARYFPNAKIEFDYRSAELSILNSSKFKKRLDPYYWRNKNSFFYNKKYTQLPYIPVGIKILK